MSELEHVTHEQVILAEHLAEIDRQEADDRRAALYMQGEQAYAYWLAAGASPIGRANSRQRLAVAMQAGVDPVVIVLHWLDGLAARARALAERAAKKETKRATR